MSLELLVDQVEIYQYRSHSPSGSPRASGSDFNVTPRHQRRPIIRLTKDIGTIEAARLYAAEFGKPVVENLCS